MTFAEQEQRLWEASRDYVRGDIDIDELRAIEQPYAATYRTALLAMARRRTHWTSRLIRFVRRQK